MLRKQVYGDKSQLGTSHSALDEICLVNQSTKGP